MAKEGEVRLELWIKSASNLVNRDFGSKSDPYVLFLVNSREACRTKVIKDDLNPKWDQRFTLDIEGPILCFQMSLFDEDFIGQGDPLGDILVKGVKDGTYYGGKLGNVKHGEIDYEVVISGNDACAGIVHSVSRNFSVSDVKQTEFGKENGEEIENKETILSELDSFMDQFYSPLRENIAKVHGEMTHLKNKPPAVEYIFVEPFGAYGVVSTNPYGHAAVRYTLGGEQKVFNIVGFGGVHMVTFIHPNDYLFGTCGWKEGNEAGGIYNRTFHGLRIENVHEEKIEIMDAYFRALEQDARSHQATYSMVTGQIANFFSGTQYEGNCASWSSKGLVRAGLMGSASSWPKEIWLLLRQGAENSLEKWHESHGFEVSKVIAINSQKNKEKEEETPTEEEVQQAQKLQEEQEKRENEVREKMKEIEIEGKKKDEKKEKKIWEKKGSSVAFQKQYSLFDQKQREGEIAPYIFSQVTYRRIPGVQSYGGDKNGVGLLKPLHWIKSAQYRNVEEWSDVIVEVPEGTKKAIIRINEKKHPPSS